MNTKAELKRKIYELDFALLELNLFLDTHPTNMKAMELLKEYRKKRSELVAVYEQRYGCFINSANDVEPGSCWKWLKGPWPWENNFMEE